MCKCYKIEQAINHHDIKVSRQEARKEIEFGLETYEEIQEAEIDEYWFSNDTHLSDKLYKLELQYQGN